MEGEVRKARGETSLAFMLLAMLGLVTMVGGDFLIGPGAHTGLALVGLATYFVLFVWTFYRTLTGRSGYRMLGDLFGLTVGYGSCIGFYAPGQYTVWVITGWGVALILIGIASYDVDWIEKRKVR